MSKIVKTFLIILLGLITGCNKVNDKPNVIYILADDLGYGELGIYGQKIIETPNMMLLQKGYYLLILYWFTSLCSSKKCTYDRSTFWSHAY